MAEPKTIKLRTPIALGAEGVSEITIRPVTGKDLRGLDVKKGNLDMTLTLAGRLSGQPDIVIDKLTGKDLAEVLSVTGDFLGECTPSGSDE